MQNAKQQEPPDLEFLVGKDPHVWRIPAHTRVLAQKSPVFQKQMETMKAGEQTIVINDMKPEIFQEFLKFLYSNEADFTCVEMALGLYKAGHKYEVQPLLYECKCYLVNMIGEFSVLEAFPVVKQYVNEKDAKLLLHCYRVIDRNIDSLLTSKAFDNLPLDLVKEICSRGNLKLSSELLLFQSLVRWTTNECKRRSLPVTHWNVRLILGDVIYTVRFDQICMQDLFREFMNSGLFSESEAQSLVNSIYGCGEQISKNHMSSRHYQEVMTVHRFAAENSIVLSANVRGQSSPHAAIAFTFDRDVILEAVRLSAKAGGLPEHRNSTSQGSPDTKKMPFLVRRYKASAPLVGCISQIEEDEQLEEECDDLGLITNMTKKKRSEEQSGFYYDDRAHIILTDENSKILSQVKRGNDSKPLICTDTLVTFFLADPVLLKPGHQYRLYSWLPASRALIYTGQGQSSTTFYDGTSLRTVQWHNCPPLEHQESINGTSIQAGQYFGLQIYF